MTYPSLINPAPPEALALAQSYADVLGEYALAEMRSRFEAEEQIVTACLVAGMSEVTIRWGDDFDYGTRYLLSEFTPPNIIRGEN